MKVMTSNSCTLQENIKNIGLWLFLISKLAKEGKIKPPNNNFFIKSSVEHKNNWRSMETLESQN